MTMPMRSIILPFLSLLFLLLHPLSPGAATARPDIILETCKQCSDGSPNVNYRLCAASLGSVRKSHRSDLRGLSVISVKVATTNASQVQSRVKKLIEANPNNSHYVNSCLKTCLELYTGAISSLKDSAIAIKSGHYDDANVWISSAVDAPVTCEDGFTEGNIKSPLAEEDEGFFHLAVIALGIAALLR